MLMDSGSGVWVISEAKGESRSLEVAWWPGTGIVLIFICLLSLSGAGPGTWRTRTANGSNSAWPFHVGGFLTDWPPQRSQTPDVVAQASKHPRSGAHDRSCNIFMAQPRRSPSITSIVLYWPRGGRVAALDKGSAGSHHRIAREEIWWPRSWKTQSVTVFKSVSISTTGMFIGKIYKESVFLSEYWEIETIGWSVDLALSIVWLLLMLL